ncbi:MAG: magnesium transporter [Planctomycetota bacterium]
MAGEEAKLSALQRLIRFGSEEDLGRFFLLLRPQELADLVEALPDEEDRLRAIRAMETPLASEVLREVEPPEREEILEDLPAEEIAEIVRESRTDDAADLLGELETQKAEETLEHLDRPEQEELRELLEYPDDSAGGIMQTELVKLRASSTVSQAVDEIRSMADELGEVHEIFVVDDRDRLVGRVGATALLLARPDASIESIMEREPVAVPVTIDQEELAEIVKEYDLTDVPVIDAEGRLVGQVMVDDVLDVLEEEATEDIAHLAGVNPDELYGRSVLLSIRSRAPWLIPAFGGGILAAMIIGSMEGRLKSAELLIVFIPVVLGMAGNASMQTATLTVRGLALGRSNLRAPWRAVSMEALTGLSLGVLFGGLLYLYTLGAYPDDPRVALYAVTAGLSILTAMTVGATMGMVVPLTLNRFKIDPAIATSPFVTTANDVLGAGLLFLVAHWVGLL